MHNLELNIKIRPQKYEKRPLEIVLW